MMWLFWDILYGGISDTAGFCGHGVVRHVQARVIARCSSTSAKILLSAHVQFQKDRKKLVRQKPDQPDRLLRPCGQYNHSVGQYNRNVGQYNHSVGQYNHSVGQYNHSVGQYNHSVGQYNHSVGKYNRSVGQYNRSVGQYNHSVGQYNHSVGLGSCKWSIGSDSLLKIPEAILAPENKTRLNDALFLGTVEPPVPGGAQDFENACN